MSHEIVKSLSVNEKDNKIFLTSCSNNCGRNYTKWEYCPNSGPNSEGNYDFKHKICSLLKNIAGGNIHLPKSNKWACVFLELEKMLGDVYNADNDLIFSSLEECEKLYKKNKEKDKLLRVSEGVYSDNYILKKTKRRILFTDSPAHAVKLSNYEAEDIQRRFDEITFETITTE